MTFELNAEKSEDFTSASILNNCDHIHGNEIIVGEANAFFFLLLLLLSLRLRVCFHGSNGLAQCKQIPVSMLPPNHKMNKSFIISSPKFRLHSKRTWITNQTSKIIYLTWLRIQKKKKTELAQYAICYISMTLAIWISNVKIASTTVNGTTVENSVGY